MNCGNLQIGLDRLIGNQRELLRGRRFGLLTCRASVDAQLRSAETVLAAEFPDQLQCLFTPQHGLWAEQQANMVESGHCTHPRLNIPVFSLYSETRYPHPDMLRNLDALVIDLPDVGTRVYTFIWTVKHCLEACAEVGLPVVLLDRPNPLGGVHVEGPRLNEACRSFVGEARIPMRHGLTIGELAQFFNDDISVACELTVVPMANWRPEQIASSFGRYWIPPSPNMPTLQTALVYPGQVLLEGTNLSEGRGTTTPFEICGAPFIDPEGLSESMQCLRLPGVRFLATQFTPTFDKWAGKSCGGVAVCVTDASQFHSLRTTAALLGVCFRDYPDAVSVLPPPYEYETILPPVDIISGSNNLREWFESSPDPIDGVPDSLWRADVADWSTSTARFRLYQREFAEASATT